MNISCCTPDYFALFLYVRPGNKVKSISIMIVWVETILLAVLYNHPFVAKKGGDFDRLVVSEFYALQSISFFQPLQIVVITADIAIGKNGIQCSTMYTLRNLLVRIERFFGWSTDNLCFELVGFYQSGKASSLMRKAKGSNSRSRIWTASTTLIDLSSLSTSTCMMVSALLFSSVPMCPRAFSSFLFW